MYKDQNEILPKILVLTLHHHHYFRSLGFGNNRHRQTNGDKILVVVLYSGRNISDHWSFM